PRRRDVRERLLRQLHDRHVTARGVPAGTALRGLELARGGARLSGGDADLAGAGTRRHRCEPGPGDRVRALAHRRRLRGDGGGYPDDGRDGAARLRRRRHRPAVAFADGAVGGARRRRSPAVLLLGLPARVAQGATGRRSSTVPLWMSTGRWAWMMASVCSLSPRAAGSRTNMIASARP